MAKEQTRKLQVRIARDGQNLRTDIADTGPGLPKEVSDNLFAAFVTTKSTGMGLGLSICQQIVSAHGGQLTARPNEPNGTVFTFTLPLTVESQAAAPKAERPFWQ
jgi:signal transduction histidine kinase